MDARDVIKIGMSAERTLVVPIGAHGRAFRARHADGLCDADDDPGNGAGVGRRDPQPSASRAGSPSAPRSISAISARRWSAPLVRTTAKVIAVERRVIRFEVEAFDGERTHRRRPPRPRPGQCRDVQQAAWRRSSSAHAVIVGEAHRAVPRRMAVRTGRHPSRRRASCDSLRMTVAADLLRQILRALRRRRDRARHQRLHAVRRPSALPAPRRWCRRAR